MTKGELIRFLEPFTDDIKIVIANRRFDGDDPVYSSATASYMITKGYPACSGITQKE